MLQPRHDKTEFKASVLPSHRLAWRSLSASVFAAAALAACGGGTDTAPQADANGLDAANSATTASVEPVLLPDGSYPAEAPTNAMYIPAGDSGAGAASADSILTASAADASDSDEGRTAHAMSVSGVSMVPAGSPPPPPPPPPPPTGAGIVTLGWAAPATKANGSSVGTLAGYRIYYGTTSGTYAASVMVSGSTMTSGTVSGLASGKWYFSVAAVDTNGYESTIGYELSKTL